MPRKNEPTERQCIVTRTVEPIDCLVRFVRAPDGSVVADLKGNLPGRGVWVTAARDVIAAAVARRLFARGFKEDVQVDPDLPARVESLLVQAALGALSLARKAGQAVFGHTAVTDAIAQGTVLARIEATDGAADGRRKIDQAVTRRYGRPDALSVVEIFDSPQLDLALGRSHVIHAALLTGPAGQGVLERAERIVRFRQSSGTGLSKPTTVATRMAPVTDLPDGQDGTVPSDTGISGQDRLSRMAGNAEGSPPQD
ncbi:RNA-binding protein [Segnochrobactraceae bacterium EtOH-i3]